MRTAMLLAMGLLVTTGALAQQPGETARPTRPRFVAIAPVYFDFDAIAIRADASDGLLKTADVLRANPDARIRIVGHTDEHGSASYNDRLGRRRAAAVKSFLVEHGISTDQLETASAGEREPAEAGHDEEAWSKNRRVEFKVLGDTPLRLPQR